MDNSVEILLIDACQKGRLDLVQDLVRNRNVNVNCRNTHGYTPLMTACSFDHSEVAKFLLENGADPTMDKNSLKPIMLACRNGNLEIVQKIFSNPDYRHDFASDFVTDKVMYTGWTLLTFAISENRLEIAQFLLAHGANVEPPNEPDEDFGCSSPLIVASNFGYLEAVRLLIRAGAHLERTYLHKNAICYAAENGHDEVVAELINAGSHLSMFVESKTPLLLASRNGHFRVVKILIDAGVQLERFTDVLTTPLVVAAAHGHSEVVRLLVESGRHATSYYSQAFNIVCVNGNVEIAKIFLKAGFIPNYQHVSRSLAGDHRIAEICMQYGLGFPDERTIHFEFCLRHHNPVVCRYLGEDSLNGNPVSTDEISRVREFRSLSPESDEYLLKPNRELSKELIVLAIREDRLAGNLSEYVDIQSEFFSDMKRFWKSRRPNIFESDAKKITKFAGKTSC